MKRRTVAWLALLLVTASALAACGHKEGDGHVHGKDEAHRNEESHGHEEESPTGAEFKLGRGVVLSDEAQRNLGVEVAEVTKQKLPRQIRLSVQIFGEKHQHAISNKDHAGCDVVASGFVPLEQAAVVRTNQPVEVATRSGESLAGVVLAEERAFALGESEVVVGLTNAMDKLTPGEFLPAVITAPREEEVTVIPRSALLRAAEGTFVFTVNGQAFLRTAVKVGSEADGLLEITDGLSLGDTVAIKPVETLYLIELRATKGGGHSH